MGLGRSRFPITYEEACRRAGDNVVTRLKETFEKYASNTGILPRVTFLKDIFGDGMPPKLAETLYEAFNGGQKGIKFSDLLRGLVLLIHGTEDEKITFLSCMLGEEGLVRKTDLQKFLAAVDIDPSPIDLSTLFHQDSWVGVSEFAEWIKKYPDFSSVTQWLLQTTPTDEQQLLSFTAPPDPPTYFQTLAKKFNVEQQDVMDIEKAYWVLKGSNGKFDESVLLKIMSPPLPEDLCRSIFSFLDVNCDQFIDLPEMVRGLSLMCRQPHPNRVKLCFELLDVDKDGRLNESEMKRALVMMTTVLKDNSPQTQDCNGLPHETTPTDTTPTEVAADSPGTRTQPCCDIDTLMEKFENNFKEGGVTMETFTKWSVSDDGRGLVGGVLQLMSEVCHIKMGIHPATTEEERSVVSGYMTRFRNGGRLKGQTINLISSSWFDSWRNLTNFEMKEHPLSYIPLLVPASEFPAQELPSPDPSTHNKGLKDAFTVPVADPVELVELVEVNEDEEKDEGYTHIVTSTSLSASNGSPSLEHRVKSTVNGGVTGGVARGVVRSKQLDHVNNICLCEPDDDTSFSGGKKLISLTNEGSYLKKGLQEFTDYYVLPNEVWRALVTWYGIKGFSTTGTLPRTVMDDNGTIELYPTVFQVLKHTNLPPTKQPKTGPWTSFLEVIGYMRNDTPTAPSLTDSAHPVQPRRVLYYTACFDRGTTVQQMCEHMQETLRIKPEDLRIYNVKSEDTLELLDDEDKTIEELCFNNGQRILIETRSKDNTWPEELIAVMKEMEKQELDQEKQVEKDTKSQGTRVVCGATGLSNLGNTCFMNSALQCLSNVQPLKIYFTEKDHYSEINKKNPLGSKGVMAKRYGELVQDLWSGHNKSITPLKFRFTIARHAPQFNNFQQQDAQELLSCVLDGIHEDLNRVQEKPYRELEDSDDRPDHVVGDEAWTYHLERNDSVIVDLLQGQLKSLVQCSVCGYQSLKFDPFTFLSLPLPMEQKVQLEVIVVRLDGSQPIRYGLKQELEGKYHMLKEFLVQKTNIPYFMLVDIFGGTIRFFPQDKQKMKTGLSGWLYAFEVPPPPPPCQTTPPSSRSASPVTIATINTPTEDEREGKSEEQIHVKEEPVKQDTEDITGDEEGGVSVGVVTDNEPPAEVINEDVQEEEKGACPKEEKGSTPPKDVPMDADEETNRASGILRAESEKKAESGGKNKGVPPVPLPTYCSPNLHGFVFAVHRKTLRVENYFISSQKNRPVLFSVPMVVPCVPTTPRREVYHSVWTHVQRLLIPDPPNTNNNQTPEQMTYPYVIKMVGKDGVYCCKCPWYRFCRGCTIPCDSEPIGIDDPHYLAVEWNDAFLHLKYQSALERPIDDDSMEALKQQDTKPIDLSDCFESFSRDEELGEDEYWYCKKCKDHKPAKKSLSIWRLPPILIIHLKRFQFNNGRWVKSQKVVNFPIDGLEPKSYGGVSTIPHPLEGVALERHVSITPPINEDQGIAPLEVLAEIHEENEDKNEDTPVDINKEKNGEDTKEAEPDIKGAEPDIKGAEPNIKGAEPDIKRAEPETKETQPETEEAEPDDKGEEPRVNQEQELNTEINSEGAESDVEKGAESDGENGEEPDTNQDNPTYDLFAVTCHSGVLGGGHYTSYARNPNNKWYYYNDSSCKETSESKVQNESAYMLFYELRGLQNRYNEFRAKSFRQGVKPNSSSPPPGTEEEDRVELRAGLGSSRTTSNTNKNRGGGCRAQ